MNSDQVEAIVGNQYWRDAPSEQIVAAMEMRVSRVAGRVGQAREWDGELPLLRTYSLDWWLTWMEEREADDGLHWYRNFGLQRVLMKGCKEARTEILKRFNEGVTSEFWRVGPLLLSSADNVSTDELSDVVIGELLAKAGEHPWMAILLGKAATQEFADMILTPMAEQKSDAIWIRDALEVAGRRHNRRYLIAAEEAGGRSVRAE